jgi:hypothetical protein
MAYAPMPFQLLGAYLSGQLNAIEMANTIFGYPTAIIFYLAFLLYSAGFILFGFAIWGSGKLPKWAGVLLAIHAPLLRTATGLVVGVGCAAAARRRRVGCFGRLTQAPGPSGAPKRSHVRGR